MANNRLRGKQYKGKFTKFDRWACFDALPRAIRDELNYGTFGAWSPRGILEDWMSGESEEALLARIRAANAQAELVEAKRTWGRG